MKIPTFSLQDQNDNTLTDKDLLGSWSLIYFYPKGEIMKKYEGVDPKTHIKEIFDDFKQLSA